MDILFFEPIFKDYIWGGTKLKEVLQKETPFERTAESWEIASNKNGDTLIREGVYQGKTVTHLFEDNKIRKEVFGEKCVGMDRFPLLIKYIDANDSLSVQVHPDDEYAKRVEQESGKTEMWYIMDCEPGAQLICGLTKEIDDLSSVLEKQELEKYLRFIPVQKGDCLYIPAGTVHAILKGCLICEIQQNSDLTYRLFDWNRVGTDGKSRELHVQKAQEVIRMQKPEKRQTREESCFPMIHSPYFTVDKIVVKEERDYEGISKKSSFKIVNVVEGAGKVVTKQGEKRIKQGDTFLIPASLGKYQLKGELQCLISYV